MQQRMLFLKEVISFNIHNKRLQMPVIMLQANFPMGTNKALTWTSVFTCCSRVLPLRSCQNSIPKFLELLLNENNFQQSSPLSRRNVCCGSTLTLNLADLVEVMWAVLPPSCSLKQSVKGSKRPMAKILEQSLSASSGSSCCCFKKSFSKSVRPGQQVRKTRVMWLQWHPGNQK